MKKVELVCPAGNLPSLRAAIDNGADVVYTGFNDAAISILALIAGVIGGALTRGQAIVAELSGRSSQEPGYRRSRYDCRCQDHTGRGWGR